MSTSASASARAPGLWSRFRSPRPLHAYVLTRNRLVYVGARPGEKRASGPTGVPLVLLSRPLPADLYRTGPAGVPIAGKALSGVVAELVAEMGGRAGSASLAVPDDFLRIVTVDIDDPDKDPKATEEILLWKLGKVFGEPLPALRFDWLTAGPGAEGLVRVVALATLEEAAESFESAFHDAGIRIGALEPCALAVATLASRALPPDSFVVWADGGVATTVFLKGGELRFLRTKATDDPDEALQEIRLAASFVSGEGREPATPLDVEGACAAGPVGSPIVDRFRAFRAENGATDPKPISRGALVPEALILPGLTRAAATLAGAEDPAAVVALGLMAGED